VSGQHDHREHESELDPEAIDLALVHADDEYLDLLNAADLEDQDGLADDQLTALLMSWRQEVDSEPIDELVDTKLAVVTVQAAKVRRKRRPRLLVPIAAAAAVLAIAFAGVGLAARDAQPGDTLWALTKVLYAEHARSVEAASEVREDLREAEAALTDGRVAEAKSKLDDAHAALPTVSHEDGQADLEAQHASLLAQLPGNPNGEAGPPPAPDPTTKPNPGSGSSDGSGSSESPSVPPTDTSPSTPPDSTSPTEPPPSTDPTRSEDPTGTNSEPLTGEAAPPAEAPVTEN
jgi:hypothetical protein